jgi:hypothetical protein
VPLKVAARRAEGVELGDDVTLVVVVEDPDVPDDDASDGAAATPRAAAPRPAAPHHDPAEDDDYFDPAAGTRPAPR